MAKAKAEGIGKIRKSMQRFARKAGPAAAEAMFLVAKHAAELASQKAPQESGEIARRIGAVKTAKGAIFVSQAPHSIHVEYGTSEQGAQAYMRPSLRKALRKARKEVRDLIKRRALNG